MTTQATDAAARIREMVEQVMTRHVAVTDNLEPWDDCAACPQTWPCDAARLATVVETLVTALEFEWLMAEMSKRPGDMQRIERAIADAARELEGGSDE